MLREGQLVYALVVAVDVEGFSRLGILEQAAVVTRLKKVLGQAARRARLLRTKWLRQSTGDGEVAVLPPGTDVSRVVAEFTHELAKELRRPDRPRLRVRVSMHHGALTGGAFGPVGDALVVACRLLDTALAREALADRTGEEVVLVISRSLYEDVVVPRFRGLHPARFQPLCEEVKGRTYRGYVCAGSPRFTTPREENEVAALSGDAGTLRRGLAPAEVELADTAG
ncbi:hypothetical protein [Amycolatopsis sp. DG1A-15b]|uniref:hypothetical protein n=1 Tax=Amycolatopsis sp. DG1A-15b TaxID=3052846 RepID=UPI00255B903C|nr:hypothetical protein [Amycolatopsis sp. DG1A-15b]WIX88722.1 hypothetical protein QRY02_47750 [Amycolatopsis sp. DG1A-15b]